MNSSNSIDITPSDGYPHMYDFIGNSVEATANPTILIIFTFIIIAYYILFYYLGVSVTSEDFTMGSSEQKSPAITFIEIIMWGLFIFLIMINGVQYFFKIDVKTSLKNLFSPTPEVDISVQMDDNYVEDDDEEEEEIMIEKQVFHVPNNIYTYEDAKAVCKAFNAELADYDQIEDAYKQGAEWCGYGWSKDQMALYPTQKKTWKELQKTKDHKHDCGRPGINGGFIDNTKAPFGVNCYGYKPKITSEEQDEMDKHNIVPKNKKDIKFDKLVKKYRNKLKNILVSPFNYDQWSYI